MSDSESKAVLQRYLQTGRDALLWKLEGLTEQQIRLPLVPTGTNLLGLLKHEASTESEYLGSVFGRPFGETFAWMQDDAEPNGDMWATREESREWIVDFAARVWSHSDATIEQLPLDAVGRVPWWPGERAVVTLQQILVHVIAETHRHAGHADIVRELIDGAAGLRKGNDNLPDADAQWWQSYRARLDEVADSF